MFTDSEITALVSHLGQDIGVDVRETYLTFATSDLCPELNVTTGAHGYIERELRFYRGDQWYFSAVLNKNWVLWYWRWPAIRDQFIDKDHILSSFDQSEETNSKDIKLRVMNQTEARMIVGCLV